MYYYGCFLAEKKVLERWWSTCLFIKFAGMSVLLKDFAFA